MSAFVRETKEAGAVIIKTFHDHVWFFFERPMVCKYCHTMHHEYYNRFGSTRCGACDSKHLTGNA